MLFYPPTPTPPPLLQPYLLHKRYPLNPTRDINTIRCSCKILEALSRITDHSLFWQDFSLSSFMDTLIKYPECFVDSTVMEILMVKILLVGV